MAVRLRSFAILATVALVSPAQAESSAAWKVCIDTRFGPGRPQIESCTIVIKSPTTVPADRAFAYYQRAMAWTGVALNRILDDPRNDIRNAIADFTEAIKLNPKFTEAYLYRGYTWFSAGDHPRAVADFTAAIKLNPDLAGAYEFRMAVYRQEGQFGPAIADMTEVIRIQPKDPHPYYERGLLWIEEGNREQAAADFMRAIQVDPKFRHAYPKLGQLMVEMGELERAISIYDQAIKTSPYDDLYLLMGRGFVHFLRGADPAAADDFGKSLDIIALGSSPGNDQARILAAIRYLARARAKQDASAELAAVAGRMEPPSRVIDLYLGRGSADAALKAAAGDGRDQCQTEFFVAHWHLLRGNRDEARKYFQAAYDRCRDQVLIYYWVATAAAAELRSLQR
jgi:tetratricopeptide (TPR) repeat protein